MRKVATRHTGPSSRLAGTSPTQKVTYSAHGVGRFARAAVPLRNDPGRAASSSGGRRQP